MIYLTFGSWTNPVSTHLHCESRYTFRYSTSPYVHGEFIHDSKPLEHWCKRQLCITVNNSTVNHVYVKTFFNKHTWFCVVTKMSACSHHWCRSDRPFHRGSVRTILSMSFFHSIPSEMTLCHSLHTSSAEHSERASRNDKMFSAMWSRPWAGERWRVSDIETSFISNSVVG